MNKSIFGFIWTHSKHQQIAILALTVISFPFLYISLELPKRIINNAISGKNFPMQILGVEFEQIHFLLVLCGLLLTLIIVNGVFKMSINVFKGIIAERLLRRLRYTLYERILRFPMSRFKKISQGELVSMITAEVESIGIFFGNAIALPAFQGGTMLTIVFFMFMQNPLLGLASVALIPVQGWLIPKLQRQINLHNRERVKEVRQLSSQISEAVSGIQDIHSHDNSAFNLARFSNRLGSIFKIRLSIYKKKFFMKFLNNFIGSMTPLMFYSLGGVLVIKGDMTIGSLVAALAAYKDLSAPWRELLRYYQSMSNSRVKYEQVIDQFELPDLMDEKLLKERPDNIPSFKDILSLQSLTFIDEDRHMSLNGISVDVPPGSRIAITANGKTCDELAGTLARLLRPTAGSINVGAFNLINLPEAIIGARIGYVGPDSYVFNGTAIDNAFLGLKREAPVEENMGPSRLKEYEEALASGNSPANIEADWIDYQSVGFANKEELDAWWLDVMRVLEVEGNIYARGLSMRLDTEKYPELATGILKANKLITKRMHENSDLSGLVHPFDLNTYDVNASVGSNLVFGEPIDPEFAFERLGNNSYVRWVLNECGLEERFVNIGIKVADTMIGLFKDLSPDHPLFEQFSFLDEEGLQELRQIVTRIENSGLASLKEENKAKLTSLAFLLIVDRHRLGLIDEKLQKEIVKARHLFREKLPEDKKNAIAYFDQGDFNDMLSIRRNLIMGSLNLQQPHAEERVNELTREVLDELGLRDAITVLATNVDVGIGGRRLSQDSRQKLALARSLLKKPDILIINEALSALDRESQQRIRKNIHELLPETTMIWLGSERLSEQEFDSIYVIRDGRIAETITGNIVEEAKEIADEEAETPAEESEPTALDLESQVLANVPIFSDMSRSNLKLLAFSSQRLSFAAGEELSKQGDVAYATDVIIEGEVEAVRELNGRKIALFRTGPGQICGYTSLFNNQPRPGTLRAVTDVTVLRIEKDVFLNLTEHDSHLASNLLHVLSNRLDQTLTKLEEAA